MVRTFRCPGGTLTISFTSTPPDVKQRSDWEVVKGLGSFEGLSGGGRMRGVLESGRRGGPGDLHRDGHPITRPLDHAEALKTAGLRE